MSSKLLGFIDGRFTRHKDVLTPEASTVKYLQVAYINLHDVDVNVCNGNGCVGDKENDNDKEGDYIKTPLELVVPSPST